MTPVRTVVVWCPDWPVTAASRDAGLPSDAPVAVLDRGRVFACSQAARQHGVRRGLRVREAQARCPDLVVVPYDPAVDAREFEPVVTAIEALAPHVEIIRPGRCALAAKGPLRYYGDTFGHLLRSRLAELGYTCVIGIADGPFAAEQAARLAEQSGQPELAFPPGESARCLAPLPIDTLPTPDGSELVDLLRRLGIRTLGTFAALPARQVLSRFGYPGLAAHQLAAGRDDRPLATRRPPPELATEAVFEPPVDRVDQVAFAARVPAEQLVSGLAERDLVCTCLRVEVHTERDEPRSRQWRHPRWFSASDVVDRVRWQVQAARPAGDAPAGDAPAAELTSGVIRIRLVPDDVARTGAFHEGLWGDQAPDERIHRALTRVQSMVGHESVVTAVLSGGRAPGERMTLVPWGDEVTPARPTSQPWPGHLPPPVPSTVLTTLEPVTVLDPAGRPVEVSDRGVVSGACRSLVRSVPPPDGAVGHANGSPPHRAATEIVGWAGPWPADERWWDPATASRCARFQVVCADGSAFVLRYETASPAAASTERAVGGHARDPLAPADDRLTPAPAGGRWWIEACYD